MSNPVYGGGLDLYQFPARCTHMGGCGWEGVPTFIGGVAQTECPRCERDDDGMIDSFPHEEKVGRNAPCPCGSGKKFKKCCL